LDWAPLIEEEHKVNEKLPGNRPGKSRFSRYLARLNEHRWLYLFFLPVLAYFFIFNYLPMYGVTLAFKNFNYRLGIAGSPWVGLQYFNRLFNSKMFMNVMINTLQITLKRIVFGFPAPIILALLINEITHVRYKRVVQTISYLPYFLSWVIIGGIMKELLSPSRGLVNYFLGFLGMEPIYFLTQPEMFQTILIISGIWAEVGWGTVIYLAAISGVDQELYEAAVSDGAGRWRCIWNITLPSITPIISILFILGMAGILNGGFDQVFNLYNSQVYSTGDIIDTYVYRIGLLDMNFSLSTAVNLFKNVVGLILVLGTNMITRRINRDNALW